MKKKVICIAVLCLALVFAFLFVREVNYDCGKEQGYLIGYSIGYTDGMNGEKQDSQELAGSIAPYAFGEAKWKGFMMGFPEGYSDGYAGSVLTE